MSNHASFLELIEVHQWLDGLFLAHQTALLSIDVKDGRAYLRAYESQLSLHLADEDNLLIPIYEARTADVPGGAVELFSGEHEKVKPFIAEFHDRLNRLRAMNDLPLKQQIIKLFDRQAIFKGLLEHHHAREQNILFPWLDRVTSSEEKASLLGQCASLAAFKASMAGGAGA
jgi:hemerythrin-like domain-containing protein